MLTFPEFSIVSGIVCKTNIPDCAGDLLTKDDVRKLYNHNHELLFDINHSNEPISKVKAVVNKINRAGDWVVTCVSNNAELNQMIYDKEITGFSLASSLDTGLCSIGGCQGECNYEDYDIKCWEPQLLSFVKAPCNQLPFTEVNFYNNIGGKIVWTS